MTDIWYHVSTQQEFSQIPMTTRVNVHFHQMDIGHWFRLVPRFEYNEIIFDKCHFIDSVLDDLWIHYQITFIQCTQRDPEMFIGEIFNGDLFMHCIDMDFSDPKCLTIHCTSETPKFYYDNITFVRCVITQDMIDNIIIDAVKCNDCVFQATHRDLWRV